MQILNDLYAWITDHKAALALGAGWFLHMGYPYIRDNGGIVGIVKVFISGKPQPISAPTAATAAQPTKTE